jgi:thiol-disulfide isomerase/thioredoxin
MVNFRTYGCYNCINTLPHVTKLHPKYKDTGLVVVGVHTPEFPFEKSIGNVQAALKRHGIQYPVAQDNDSTTWAAYRYWPAQYIVDQGGKIVYFHAGEGAYDEIERTIQNLLKISSQGEAGPGSKGACRDRNSAPSIEHPPAQGRCATRRFAWRRTHAKRIFGLPVADVFDVRGPGRHRSCTRAVRVHDDIPHRLPVLHHRPRELPRSP